MGVVRLSVGTFTVDLVGEVVCRRYSGEVVTRTGARRAVRAPHSYTTIVLAEPPSPELLRVAGRHVEVVVDGVVHRDARVYIRGEPPWEVVVHP